MKTFTAKLYDAVRATFLKYPALTSLVINAAVVLAAKYGFSITPDMMLLLFGLLNSALYVFIHSAVTPVVKLKVDYDKLPPGYTAPMTKTEE